MYNTKFCSMKKFYPNLTKVLVILLVALIPAIAFSQDEAKEEKKSTRNTAPSYSYWSVQAFGGIMQFNGDLSRNLWINLGDNALGYNYGLVFTKQFTRVIGVRARIAHGKLQSEVDGKFVYDPDKGTPTNPAANYIHESFVAYPWETDLQLTVNWLNWILGNKPERIFSSYAIFGIGADQTIGHKRDDLLNTDIAWIGQKDRTNNMGNTSGIAGHNLEFKVGAGLGFDINIHKNWSINPEFYWRWRDGDILDMQKGGVKEIKNDMYSSLTLGLTYKFGYRGGNIKEMAKRYDEVKYEVNPAVLSEKGDTVQVTIKGTFPEKYFAKKAGMYFQPVLKYEGGEYALPEMHLMGEKLTGDGTMIMYKEGGSFTYTASFPYSPEMNTSELVVEPIIYEAKEVIIPKKAEIKVKGKFIELPSRTLAPGVIYTPTRISNELVTLIAEHGYQKEVIVNTTGDLYFPKNKYAWNAKFGLNKTDAAKEALTTVDEWLHKGWKLKNITIDGWASPEGEETFNVGLSENRSKTGHEYMVNQYKTWKKEELKDNKDLKWRERRDLIEAAADDVPFVLEHHGPDWNGFLKAVQNSNIKDKDKILNVINSARSEAQKEEEIRNMILIYPEIEEDLLPPLRRADITVNLYEPRFTDQELSKMAVASPDKLNCKEILYAGTLTNDISTQVEIYENAAKTFPDSWKANNNAAVANIAAGNTKAALNYLEKANKVEPNNGIVMNNLGVVYTKMGEYDKAADYLKKAKELGENTNYNQGVLLIPKGQYQKAAQMLAGAKCDYNLGLLQLVSGNTTAAETTLKCAPQTPETFYLLAIVGAKKNDTQMLYDYLMKACKDENLKAQAKGDREFYDYANTPEFQNIVK